MEEESGTSYLEALARQWYLVGAFALLGLVGAYLYSGRADDVYSASSELLFSSVNATADPFGDDAQTSSDRARDLNNAVAQLRSDSLRNEVKAALDGDPLDGGVSLDDVREDDPDASERLGGRSALLGGLDVRSSDDSDALRVIVESVDPTVASDAANLYVAGFRGRRTDDERSQLNVTSDSLNAQIASAQPQIASLEQQITSEGRRLNPNLALIDTLTSRAQLLRTDVAEFQRQLQSIDFQLENLSGGIEVLSPAGVPSSPIRPTPLRDGLLGAIGGLVVGGGIGFLRSERDRSLRSPATVEALSGVPVLGSIPLLRELPFARPRVVALEQPSSAFAEAFAAVRSALQIVQLDDQVRTILVTSTVSGEGKSTVVANLAVVFARTGARVTVVGADLRNPSIHEVFGLSNEPGLSNVVVGNVPLGEAIVELRIRGGTPIRVLAAGPEPPNPAELLATSHAGNLLAALAADSDVVLIDATPVTPVTDATVLSRWADAVVVVCAEGMTHEDDLRTTMARLRQARADIIGVVYNRSRRTTRQGYYGREERWFQRRRRTPTAGGQGESRSSRRAG